MPSIESPCIKVCAVDPRSGLCLGCGRSLAEIAADKSRTYDYLLRVSMIASLRRAQELG